MHMGINFSMLDRDLAYWECRNKAPVAEPDKYNQSFLYICLRDWQVLLYSDIDFLKWSHWQIYHRKNRTMALVSIEAVKVTHPGKEEKVKGCKMASIKTAPPTWAKR